MNKVWDAIKWLWMGFMNALGYALNSTIVNETMSLMQMLAGTAIFMIIIFGIALLLTVVYKRYLS